MGARRAAAPQPKRCKDCEPGSKRPAPFPGPRCATHHRARKRIARAQAAGRLLVKRYGLDADEYGALYAYQGERCAICQRATGARKALAVDHDHTTLVIRGLLCGPCNHDLIGRYGLGALERAVRYLENPPAIRVFGVRMVPGE